MNFALLFSVVYSPQLARLCTFFFSDQSVDTYRLGEFSRSSTKVDGLFLFHDVKRVPLFTSRVFTVLDSAMWCGFHPLPRLYFSCTLTFVGADANYLSVKCCVHVPFGNSSTLTNKILCILFLSRMYSIHLKNWQNIKINEPHLIIRLFYRCWVFCSPLCCTIYIFVILVKMVKI